MATNNAYVNGILNVREQLQKCWVADLDWSLLPENVGNIRNATTHAVTRISRNLPCHDKQLQVAFQ